MGSPNPKLSREHHCHKQLNRSKNRVITYDIGKNHQDPKKDLMNREILIDCHKNIYDDCIYYFNYLLRVLSRTNKALIVFSWSKWKWKKKIWKLTWAPHYNYVIFYNLNYWITDNSVCKIWDLSDTFLKIQNHRDYAGISL